jgi:hypothetical protein
MLQSTKNRNTSKKTYTNSSGDFFLKKVYIIHENRVKFLAANDIQVSGIEFICNAEGEIFSYDINTNTNYNSDAEEKAGKYGMLELVKVLKYELEKS